ncbi:MAG: AIR synthase-related protein, partial [Pirellulales bacterium]
VHRAIRGGHVRACHDLSEGGLAVAAAEMAFAGGLGAAIDLASLPHTAASDPHTAAVLLFSESNTRFLCEVAPDKAGEFEARLAGVPHARIGTVTAEPALHVAFDAHPLMVVDVARLKAAWQATFDWT